MTRSYGLCFGFCLLAGLPVLPTRQGEFIFFHNNLINAESSLGEETGWARLKRFRLLLTNGYATFSPDRVTALRQQGCQLFFYFWFNGFYAHEAQQPLPDGDWRREILQAHRDWLLNPDQPEQGGGAVKPAYFFDLTRPALRQFLARVIAAHRQRTGYDGVFFDYAGSYALPPAVLKRHQQRYPNIAYDAAGAQFLRAVKAADPGILIFTNQAHRAAQYLLPVTDIDADESVATSFLWGKEIKVFSAEAGWVNTRETFYRAWDGAHGIKAHYTDLAAKARRFNPRVRLVTINYVKAFWEPTGQTVAHAGQPHPVCRRLPDRAAIFYGYVAAKLFGFDSYSSDWYDVGCYEDEVFLIDLGRPRGTAPEEREGLVVRYYDNGFVALTKSERGGAFDVSSAHIPSDIKGLWDVYERRWVADFPKQRRIQIQPTIYPISRSTYPSGRVYIYVR
ncbi:MAG: hypothetical protein NZT92_04825 [Abditibacteriales bacterium]|nr:hypothetical protein [Abditibacteriales bacterium]MDW8365254.1 hypothetical protein [Abditibacteriales bacterium]